MFKTTICEKISFGLFVLLSITICFLPIIQQNPELPVKWITADYATVDFSGRQPDIIFSSLFCHHFNESELVSMIKWMKKNSNNGFFINDLQRNWFAYHSIKIITDFFSSSYLVKNDAPLSVARGFHKKEWLMLLEHAGIDNYSVEWKWAFRYLIIYRNAAHRI